MLTVLSILLTTSRIQNVDYKSKTYIYKLQICVQHLEKVVILHTEKL